MPQNKGAKPLDSIDMDLDESVIEKEQKAFVGPNEMVERPVEISVSHLVRTFGDFTAVANTSFTVQREKYSVYSDQTEPGKTTTFRMLLDYCL